MISIIIPTLKEADALPRLLGDLEQEGGARLRRARHCPTGVACGIPEC